MPRYSEETKQRARELYAQGLSQCEIGRRLGAGKSTVCRWVNHEAAECTREYSRRWYQENPERAREYSRQWRQENPERIRECQRRWYQENLERAREYSRQWRQENPERRREQNRRWTQKNSDRVREYCAFRRAAKRQATPPWLTTEQRKQMTALHAKARRLEKRTGIPHHVDHIIPLHTKFDGRGEQVACGLHVPWNLHILPGPENNAKYCKLPGPEHWTAPAPSGIIGESQAKP